MNMVEIQGNNRKSYKVLIMLLQKAIRFDNEAKAPTSYERHE